MVKIILEKLNSLEKKLFSHIRYNKKMNNNISPLDEGIEQAPKAKKQEHPNIHLN